MLSITSRYTLKENSVSDNASEIEQRVKQAVAEQLGLEVDSISNNASFMEDLGADSLDLVELVMAFENDFDITIPDDDSNRIVTVQSAIDYISAKLNT